METKTSDLLKDFKKAVDNYWNIIIHNYHNISLGFGNTDKQKRKVVDLFKQSPKNLRLNLLYIALKNLIKPEDGYEDLDSMLIKAASELNDELEKINNKK